MYRLEGGVETERLRDLCSALPAGVYLTGPDGSLCFVNDAFRRIVGERSIDEWIAALPADDIEEARRAWRECREHGTPFSLLLVRDDGAAHTWLRWRGLQIAEGWCGGMLVD